MSRGTVKLRESDRQFMLSHLQDSQLARLLAAARSVSERSDCLSLVVSRNDLKLFVDALSEALITQGLGVGEEPNVIGLQIEALIDIFNPYEADDSDES